MRGDENSQGRNVSRFENIRDVRASDVISIDPRCLAMPNERFWEETARVGGVFNGVHYERRRL